MKVTIDRTGDDVHMTVEREPMPPERFKTVCNLVGAAIGGAVFLGAVHLVGVSAVIGTAGILFLVGLYKLMKDF